MWYRLGFHLSRGFNCLHLACLENLHMLMGYQIHPNKARWSHTVELPSNSRLWKGTQWSVFRWFTFTFNSGYTITIWWWCRIFYRSNSWVSLHLPLQLSEQWQRASYSVGSKQKHRADGVLQNLQWFFFMALKNQRNLDCNHNGATNGKCRWRFWLFIDNDPETRWGCFGISWLIGCWLTSISHHCSLN